MPERELDALNQEISRAISAGGFAQVLTTELNGKKVLRICALNPETTDGDIRKTVELLDRLARRFQGRASA